MIRAVFLFTEKDGTIKNKQINVIFPNITHKIFDYLQILVLVLQFYNKKYGMRTSGILWVFWLLLTACSLVKFRSLLRKSNQEVTII